MGQNQRRPAGLSDDVGHRERLARARRPQQGLIALAAVHPRHQLLDHRLVALREYGAVRVVGGHGCRAKQRPSIIAGEQDEVLRLLDPRKTPIGWFTMPPVPPACAGWASGRITPQPGIAQAATAARSPRLLGPRPQLFCSSCGGCWQGAMPW